MDIEIITLRSHDGSNPSSNTTEGNTASEATEQAFTPQGSLMSSASL